VIGLINRKRVAAILLLSVILISITAIPVITFADDQNILFSQEEQDELNREAGKNRMEKPINIITMIFYFPLIYLTSIVPTGCTSKLYNKNTASLGMAIVSIIAMFMIATLNFQYMVRLISLTVLSAMSPAVAVQRTKEGYRFRNSTGLPAQGHYMSTRDIAALARHLIEKHPRVLELEAQREFTFNDIKQNNRNPLLGVFPGADGLKTGWTEEAGYCLAGTAKQNGMRIISVVLNTKNDKERLAASQELLGYGFKNFQLVEVKKSGEIVDNIDVNKGKKLTVPVRIDSGISIVVPAARKNDN